MIRMNKRLGFEHPVVLIIHAQPLMSNKHFKQLHTNLYMYICSWIHQIRRSYPSSKVIVIVSPICMKHKCPGDKIPNGYSFKLPVKVKDKRSFNLAPVKWVS